MNNVSMMAGIVMLETMWATRQKDLLDLITPFVLYSVAKHAAMAKIQDDLTRDLIEDKERENRENKHHRLAFADEKARNEASARRDKILHFFRIGAIILEVIVAGLAVCGTIHSWGNITISIFSIPVCLFAMYSIYDSSRGREKFVDKTVVRLANRIYTRDFEKRKKDYREIAEHEGD